MLVLRQVQQAATIAAVGLAFAVSALAQGVTIASGTSTKLVRYSYVPTRTHPGPVPVTTWPAAGVR